ncbi:hypothetical protein SteCoe_24219 [Stentor coeruleus]|uniref:Uncharacterized protein n=1 Tax=Stentor coeruleus TaxID=5963 RepID=A0A1R2BI85_9CILI|nr:hypothetical protein SteCoe_24219 [Stentor coeruleus]
MPMIPPHLLLAMQSNLPAEKVREMLTEQAEMLDQMVSKIKSSKEQEIDSFKGNVSKRVDELEKELFIEKNFSPDRSEIKDDLFCQRDIEMLKQELASSKLREESTYLDLQKSHHQIHMLESQLLELQRKHFSEIEHLNFENSELRRRLEATEYRSTSLQKDNEYLRDQMFSLKRQLDSLEMSVEVKKPEKPREDSVNSSFRKDYSIEETQGIRKMNNKSLSGSDYCYHNKRIVNNQESYQRANPTPEERRRPPVRKEYTEESDYRNENSIGKRKEYMPVRTIVNTSNNVTEALNWKSGPSRNDPNPNILGNLQNKLSLLTQEQYKLENEIEKLNEFRNQNAVKRKNDLELELSICQSNINSVTAKIRKLSWLSNS